MQRFNNDCRILQKPAFQWLCCLFADRNRPLSARCTGMSEQNISYLTSAYLFVLPSVQVSLLASEGCQQEVLPLQAQPCGWVCSYQATFRVCCLSLCDTFKCFKLEIWVLNQNSVIMPLFGDIFSNWSLTTWRNWWRALANPFWLAWLWGWN